MCTDLCPERFLKKLAGRKDVEDALRRLDRWTQEEALMAVAQILSLTRIVDKKVTSVGDILDAVMKGMLDLFIIHSPYPDCTYAG